MSRTLFSAAALSLLLGSTALAQTPAAPAPATPPAVDASASTSPYKVGMTIKDPQGVLIGSVARVIRTPDGATTISAKVDGRNVNLAASQLTISPAGEVISSMTKAQISASIPPLT